MEIAILVFIFKIMFDLAEQTCIYIKEKKTESMCNKQNDKKYDIFVS